MDPRFPYLSPDDREAFGRALAQLAQETFTQSQTRKSGLFHLVEKTEIPKNSIYNAQKGIFNATNGVFTPHHFRILIQYAWNASKQPLRDHYQILALAQAAGEGEYSNPQTEIKYWNELSILPIN